VCVYVRSHKTLHSTRAHIFLFCQNNLTAAKDNPVDCVWNVMAHVQKPDFVFRWNRRVSLNQRGCQFSWLLAAEVCTSLLLVVMLDKPWSYIAWRVLATHSICQFPLHFPSCASLCAITFQLDSTMKVMSPVASYTLGKNHCMLLLKNSNRSTRRKWKTHTDINTRFYLQEEKCLMCQNKSSVASLKPWSHDFNIVFTTVKYSKFTHVHKCTHAELNH